MASAHQTGVLIDTLSACDARSAHQTDHYVCSSIGAAECLGPADVQTKRSVWFTPLGADSNLYHKAS